MTTLRSEVVTLTPCAAGCRLWTNGEESFTGALGEAVRQIYSGSSIQIALPTQALVIERLRLPATEREELDGMVRLQWEKELPFPAAEISGDFLVLESDTRESTVLAMAVPHKNLENFCRPLRERGLLPFQVTPYVSHVAAACPSDSTVLAIYAEQGEWVILLAEKSRPVWVHGLPEAEIQQLSSRLPQLLLAATMEGVSTDFTQILLAPEAASLAHALGEIWEAPIRPLAAIRPPFAALLNLLPSTWRAEAFQRDRSRQIRSRLVIAGAIGLLVVGAGILDLFVLKRRSEELDRELAQYRPELELQQVRQAHSTALASAIDPTHYAVELLYLLQKDIPNPALRLTEFDQSQQQWRVVGEAPSANLAIDYLTRIKQDPELAAWQISAGPPQLLPNERAQFSILGKP